MKEKLKFILKVLAVPPGSCFWYEFESGRDGVASRFELIYLVLKYNKDKCCWGVIE